MQKVKVEIALIQVSAHERAARRQEKKNRQKKISAERDCEEILQWINERYITTRRKFIEQYNDKESGEARYITYHKDSSKKGMVLADYLIIQHLQQKRTIGVFGGESGSKFISFDVDYEDVDKAQDMAISIIQTLRGEFTLEENEILLTFSGSKGYHVEVFFYEMVPNSKLKQFYDLMLRIVGATTKDVELRPTPKQGVKLPLSLNRKTGKKCSIIHKEYLYEMEDITLLNTQAIEFSRIEMHMEDLIEFYPEVKEDNIFIEENKVKTVRNTNIDFKERIKVDYIKQVLKAGTLIESNSRHNVILGVASLFNTQGRSIEEALKVTWDIINRTFTEYNHFLDPSWTLPKLRKETERVVELVFSNNIKLGTIAKPVFLTKEDILFTLQANSQKEREMLMIMLVHAKKYANKEGVFSLTYNQIADYGATRNRARARRYCESLQTQGLLEIVQTDRFNGRRMLIDGKEIPVKDPNQYRMIYEDNSNQQGVKVKDFKINQRKDLIVNLLSKEEIKNTLGLDAYYNHYSKCFK